ncbi:MAG: HD domain-containing protein [Desulfobacteraceae bacterium]|jgi:hypothetical protein
MRCPGQDTQYWKADSIFDAKCPQCEHLVEFFKDDTTRKCGHCGHRFMNPKMDFGCASYCQFAEQCLGNLPPELLAQKEDLLKDRVAVAMKRYFKTDFKRIGHATRVARYAERIGRNERANLAVVLVAAYLHDIGAPVAQKRYGPEAGLHRSAANESEARKILEELGADPALIEAACFIVGHLGNLPPNAGLELRVVHDAHLIADIEISQKKNLLTPEQLKERIQKDFLTESGRKEFCGIGD